MKSRIEQALELAARQQGTTPEALLVQLLRQGQGEAPVVAQQVEVLPPAQAMPQQQPPRPSMPGRYAGVPMPRDQDELGAMIRYLEAESGPAGVFSDGGMSAGGVFGGAPIATAGHDPAAAQRAAQHALALAAPAVLQALAERRQQPAPYPAYPQAYPYPAPPPPQPVRMVQQTVTTYYEGPAHAPLPAQGLPPALPPWWQR